MARTRTRSFRPDAPDLLEGRAVPSHAGTFSFGHVARTLGYPTEVGSPTTIHSPLHSIKISSPGHKSETLGHYISRAWNKIF